MQFSNISIDRIIIHQVYRRGSDRERVPPTRSYHFTKFDKSAMEEFKSRVRDALGEGSKAVQMEIVNQGQYDLPTVIDKIIDLDDDDFISSSFDVAKKLTDAQNKKSIPGGIVVIFTGMQGFPKKKYLGIIKAEIHSAYEKEENPLTKEISLKFVQEVLLTPGTRLYKTAAFFKNADIENCDNLNEKYSVLISDHQISKADGKAAARYFYFDFLGCGYPQNSARTTKQFYDATTTFIDKMAVGPEKKSDLYNALITYLKVGLSTAISVDEFSSSFFETDIQDDFKSHMADAGLPTTAFTKDVEHIESKLKFRKINFSKNVKIIAPSDVFKKYVIIEPIDGDPDNTGNPQKWTRITIKDRIIQQE